MQKIKPINNPNGKLILVTAMTSNKSGIGKTTVSIGLCDALNKLGYNSMLALREPSMGPVFGIKGGATGGGKSTVQPSDEINLHFTGDFHAITSSNNLLSSIIDNHIFQGNELNINPEKIFFKRCLDLNDRSLRNIEYQVGSYKIKSGFNITAASEVMAILCLSKTITELKENLGNILVALDFNNNPIYAKDLNAHNAMTILLKDAIKPNIVKTAYGSNALIHLGPFANIAHGCNSLVATQTALSLSDYCVTEAGFGSDLGAEKFLDIKCRLLNKHPDAVVLVITLNVILEHGNGSLIDGFKNVQKHIHNIKDVFGLNMAVAINKHSNDNIDDIKNLFELCTKENVSVYITDAYNAGANGCLTLAKNIVEICKQENTFKYVYNLEDSIIEKIEKIAKNVYGASKVNYSEEALEKIKLAEKLNLENYFVNISKTQFSFSDNKNLLGAPTNFEFNVTDIEIRSGAKMIVAIAGSMLLMPGLGKSSNYLNMEINESEKIEGLF